jgi:hypothetical protein
VPGANKNASWQRKPTNQTARIRKDLQYERTGDARSTSSARRCPETTRKLETKVGTRKVTSLDTAIRYIRIEGLYGSKWVWPEFVETLSVDYIYGQCAAEINLLGHLKITFGKEGSRSAKTATHSIRFEFICENTSNKFTFYHNIPNHLITVESQSLRRSPAYVNSFSLQ